ncbi:MAG: hypothetical protein QOG87_4310 [Actinomycetota bacterium]|jgi:hypothetical protein
MDTITSRRAVLRGALTGGAVVTIGTAVVPVAGLLRPAAAQEAEKPLTEPELAAFAEAVELAAVAAYAQAAPKLTDPALQRATAGFGEHHREHAARFAAASEGKATGQPNPMLLQVVTDQLRDAADAKGTAKVLYDLESGLAGTHLYALGVSKSAPALQLTASVLPVESAHAAQIGLAVGLPLAPPSTAEAAPAVAPPFETEEKRLDPTVYAPAEEAK